MILLIRMKAAAIRAVKTTLNSIMFLLILIKTTKIIDEERFKFHYVSINSITSYYNIYILLPLNSIMFLLIRRHTAETVNDRYL